MSERKDNLAPIPGPIEDPAWGKAIDNNLGYASETERLSRRGLEDWEMVEKIEESEHNVPYWFVAVFVVLLIVAIGLNFPFWGDRPGYERAWFNWGIPAAVAYCTIASVAIYWLVDYRHIRNRKREEKAKENSIEADKQ